MNGPSLLSVIVGMSAITNTPRGQLPGDADAAIRELYSCHAKALHGYVEQFCPDRTSAGLPRCHSRSMITASSSPN